MRCHLPLIIAMDIPLDKTEKIADNNETMRRELKVAIGIAAIVAAMVSGRLFFTSSTVTVVGEGKVSAPATLGRFSYTTTLNGADLVKLTANLNSVKNTLTSIVKQYGATDDDIRSTSPQITPVVPQNQAAAYLQNPASTTLAPTYQISFITLVTVRNVSNINDLVTKLISAGVTIVSPIVYIADNQVILENQARQAAVVDAKTKALVLAKASRSFLGRLVSLNDSTVAASQTGSTTTSSSVLLTVGNVEVTRFVTATYKLW